MSEKDPIANLPPEFNPMIPLREDSPQREFPTKALPPILREMVTGIAETTGTDTAMAATSTLYGNAFGRVLCTTLGRC